MKKTNIKKDLSNKIKEISNESSIRGITLISLIITIIILLVLAGVVINLSVGENGIIGKTQNSVDKYKQAEEKEQIGLAKYENEIDIYSSRNGVYLSDIQYNELLGKINRLEPIELYSSSGTNGSFTLSEEIEEFEHIEIVYCESASTNGYSPFYLKVTPAELNSGVTLNAFAPTGNNGIFQFFSCRLTINGKNAVRNTTTYAYNTFADKGSAIITVQGTGNINILRVVGYYY